MKQLFLLLFAWIILPVNAQDKWNQFAYTNLMELEGTEYVISSMKKYSKMAIQNRELLFINTLTCTIKKITFPKNISINRVEHVKTDSLGINKVIVTNSINRKIGKKNNSQIYICSVDGTTYEPITEPNFDVSSYVVNKCTGTIVIIGNQYMNDKMKSAEKKDPEILLYSLKEMKMINTQ